MEGCTRTKENKRVWDAGENVEKGMPRGRENRRTGGPYIGFLAAAAAAAAFLFALLGGSVGPSELLLLGADGEREMRDIPNNNSNNSDNNNSGGDLWQTEVGSATPLSPWHAHLCHLRTGKEVEERSSPWNSRYAHTLALHTVIGGTVLDVVLGSRSAVRE